MARIGASDLALDYRTQYVAVAVAGVVAFFLGLVGGDRIGTIGVPVIVPIAAVLPVLFVLTRGPLWALAAYVGCYAFGTYNYSIGVGPLNLRPTDLPYVALLGWAWVARRRYGRVPRNQIGQGAWFAFICVTLLSLAPIWLRGTASVLSPGISWLRLLETVSVIGLLPYLVRSARDLQTLLRLFTAALAGEVTVALVKLAINGNVHDRLSAQLDKNALGLAAALLLVLAVHTPLVRRSWPRWYCILIALICLPFTRSIASMTAAALTIGIFGLRVARRSTARRGRLFVPIRLLTLVFGLIAALTILRPSNLPWNEDYSQSDTPARLILAEGALYTYVHHPVLGVGNARSGSPEVQSDPGLNTWLREQFPHAKAESFPDVNPSQVHDAYVQILADTGTVGGLCLLFIIIGVGRGAGAALRRPRDELSWQLARASTAGLVVVAIWCNDNGIFGGQIETASIGLFVGCLATCLPLRRQAPTADAADLTASTLSEGAAPGHPENRFAAAGSGPMLETRST